MAFGQRIGPVERHRKTFNVPATSGNYAEERITFGDVQSGDAEMAFREITALAESPFVNSATVELWLPKVADGSEAASDISDADYTLAGTNFTTLTAAGGVRWVLSAYPGAQIRVKSGGVTGGMSISATGI